MIKLKKLLKEGLLKEGYTLSFDNSTPWTDQEWAKLVNITKQAISTASKHGIVVRGAFGNGSPIVNDKEIALNGDASKDLDHETFRITKDGGRSINYVKTNRKPYDAVVATILYNAKKIKKSLKPKGDDGSSSIKNGGTEGWDNKLYENITKTQISEEYKHLIHVDTPTEITSKPIKAKILALAKQGVRSKDIGLEMGFIGQQKLAVDTFQKIKNKIYFELDNRY